MAVPGPAFRNVLGTPSDPQFAEVVYKGHTTESYGGTKPSNNVYHFRKRSSATPANVTSLMTAMQAVLDAKLQAAYNVDYVPETIEGRMMDDPTSPPASNSYTIAPAVSGDRLPSRDTVSIRLYTNARGANFRGRKSFSPIAESHTTLDELNATGITKWNDVAGAIQSDLNALTDGDGNTWDLIVISSDLSDLTLLPIKVTGAYVIEARLNKKIGSMRRRGQNGQTA